MLIIDVKKALTDKKTLCTGYKYFEMHHAAVRLQYMQYINILD